MKKLNKAMSVAVAAAMVVSLGACGNSADAAKDGYVELLSAPVPYPLL